MPHAPSAAPLTVAINPSRLLWALLAGAYALASIGILVCGCTLRIQAALVAVLAVTGVANWLRYGHAASPWFIARLSCTDTDDKWLLYPGKGQPYAARLIGYYSHPRLVILNFAGSFRARRSVTLLPDSASPDDLRRLRVYLGRHALSRPGAGFP